MGASRDLMQRGINTWNSRDRAAWLAQLSPSIQITGPGGLAGSGPAFGEAFYALWQDAFPDNQITPVTMAEDGDIAVLEAVFAGTHTGPLNLPTGAVQATGRSVQVPYVLIGTARDGKFESFKLYFDQVDMMVQLGLMPAPAAA